MTWSPDPPPRKHGSAIVLSLGGAAIFFWVVAVAPALFSGSTSGLIGVVRLFGAIAIAILTIFVWAMVDVGASGLPPEYVNDYLPDRRPSRHPTSDERWMADRRRIQEHQEHLAEQARMAYLMNPDSQPPPPGDYSR